MINLSTPIDIMTREIMADKGKSLYWLKKKCGGDKKYELMRDGLLLASKRDKCNKISEVYEYRSANGNRWMTYECARYYPETGTSYTQPYAFCFYETLGSAGAFVPVKVGMTQSEGRDAIIIFNSHFFHQMCERLGVGFRTPQMVRAFHEFIPSMLMEQYEEEGKQKILVRLPGSIGFGFKMRGDAEVYEVRTFLKDTQLNRKQQRNSELIRTHADKFKYEPEEIMKQRLENKAARGESLENDLNLIMEKFKILGVPEENLNTIWAVHMAIISAFGQLGYMKPEDMDAMKRHVDVNKEIICDYVQSIDDDNERFLQLLEKCAKNNGYKNFKLQDVRDILCRTLEK